MSIKALNHVIERSKQKGTRLLCLLALGNYADDSGWAYPGMDSIARFARTNRRNAIRYIQDAESDGELRVYERLDDRLGDNMSNLYKLNIPGTDKAPFPPDLKGNISDKPRAIKPKGGSGKSTTTGGGKSTTRGVVHLPLDPSVDPSSSDPKKKKKDSEPDGSGSAPARPRDLIFDAVTLHIFGIDDPAAEGGRIAKIASWLKGSYAGTKGQQVGRISKPAEVQHIEKFAAYCKTEGFTPPLDFVKFVEHWRAWASKQSPAKLGGTVPLTLEDYDRLLAEESNDAP